MNYTPEKPLYVLAIGAITNVASAILKNPEIIDRIVIVWLGGNALHWPENKEFNLYQDVAAAMSMNVRGALLTQQWLYAQLHCQFGSCLTAPLTEKAVQVPSR